MFDLGGVLIDWNPRYLFTKVFSKEDELDYFLTEVCSFEWNEEQDAGRSIEEANKYLADKYPQYRTQIRMYYERWPEMLGGILEENVRLLERLKELTKSRLFALTNWSAETFPLTLERFEFFGHFEGIVVSGEEKVKKPDDKIYRILYDRYHLAPEECIFIDDNLRNVKAAEVQGMHTIHFVNETDLESELEKRGLL